MHCPSWEYKYSLDEEGAKEAYKQYEPARLKRYSRNLSRGETGSPAPDMSPCCHMCKHGLIASLAVLLLLLFSSSSFLRQPLMRSISEAGIKCSQTR